MKKTFKILLTIIVLFFALQLSIMPIVKADTEYDDEDYQIKFCILNSPLLLTNKVYVFPIRVSNIPYSRREGIKVKIGNTKIARIDKLDYIPIDNRPELRVKNVPVNALGKSQMLETPMLESDYTPMGEYPSYYYDDVYDFIILAHVYCIADGLTNITASASILGETISDKYAINAISEPFTLNIYMDENVKDKSKLSEGDKIHLNSVIEFGDLVPADVTSQTKWESSNENIAKVDSDGTLNVTGTGDVTITARYIYYKQRCHNISNYPTPNHFEVANSIGEKNISGTYKKVIKGLGLNNITVADVMIGRAEELISYLPEDQVYTATYAFKATSVDDAEENNVNEPKIVENTNTTKENNVQENNAEKNEETANQDKTTQDSTSNKIMAHLNPKTGDEIAKIIPYAAAGVVLISIAITIFRKYSTKKKKVIY